jgi:hypothetical protein
VDDNFTTDPNGSQVGYDVALVAEKVVHGGLQSCLKVPSAFSTTEAERTFDPPRTGRQNDHNRVLPGR